jgi:predicted membrane-bound spermidine synthase/tetratricopeptide (TPR) repeat protein
VRKHLAKAVYVVFFVSGACGLVYEVIWSKYLALFIGNTTHATMIVLATFMGGLAAGSMLFGRVADRAPRPLKLYAWLEIGIGVYGTLYAPLLEYTKDLYFAAASGLSLGSAAHIAVKLLLAFLTLILPTCLMGGTLPVLSRFFVHTLGAIGKRVALLYFINSFGAVAGTLIAGFYVMEHLGIIRGLIATGAVNVAAGIAMLVLDTLITRLPASAEPPEAGETPVLYEPRFVNLAVLGVFLSGFTAMIYELAWFRLFAVVLESSTYSFSLMLAAFITGITLGSLAAGRLMARTRRVLLLFGLAELSIAAAVILTMPVYERLPYYFWCIRHLLNPVAASFPYYNLAKFLLCFAIMLAPTLFFGMTLPFVSHIASTSMGQLARKIGNVYAANTFGTLFGALCAGLVLIPWLGVAHSLETAFCLNLLIGLLVLWRTPDLSAPAWRRVGVAAAGVLVGLYALILPAWNPARFALGVFRNRGAPPPTFAAHAAAGIQPDQLVYYKEDLSSNVAVIRQAAGNETRLTLAVNGKADASSDSDMPTQILLAQLPLMLADRAEDVLLIGLGSGMTAGSALTHPLRSLDCIEISPGVAEAARLFSPYNHDVTAHPRFRLVVEDAKTYINTTKKQYDVIISEPSNPWMAGIGNLFSIEFFRDAEEVLKPDGLVVQWFHCYEVSDEVMATAVRTFHEVFPYTYIFQGNATDILMIGSKRRIAPDFERMAAKLAMPGVRDELARINVHDIPSLLAFQMISPEYIPRITAIGGINSDYRPVIEYRAPLAFYENAFASRINEHDERFTRGEHLLLSDYMNAHPLTAEQYGGLIRLFETKLTEREALVYPLMAHYLALRPDDREMQNAFAGLSLQRKNYQEALRLYRATLDEADPRALERYAELHYDAQRAYHSVATPQPFDSTLVYFYKCLAQAPQDEACLVKLGRVGLVTGRYEEALTCFTLALGRHKDAPEDAPDTPGALSRDDLLTLVGRALYHLKRFDAAREHITAALRENPANTTAAHYFLMLEQVKRFAELENNKG